jgi:hypothetical protein
MESVYSYKITMAPEWNMVREVRSQVHNLFTKRNRKIAMAASIVVSELAENAIKYGKPEIDIVCEIDSGTITFSASNEIDKRADLENLKKHINKIKSTDNPFDLYVAMLENVMTRNMRKSLLGLYRIAGEAGFMLDYFESDKRITVLAKRKVA